MRIWRLSGEDYAERFDGGFGLETMADGTSGGA